MGYLLSVIRLLLFDSLFLVAIVAVVIVLSKTKRAAYAVLKRNFLGYFSNPTGYVFLCLFVLLTSMAAFWPNEFFASNLATLNQLNRWFPFIMLFFIPAITMSIWADEKRQGTDELLLTLPADDFDIVVGKYTSAASIFSVSLLFSQLSTYIVLVFLTKGDIDTGLFFSNYLGYWFIGLAMIALGMVASFLTSNLTVGFILGALFNAPLAFASMADVISPNRDYSRLVKNLSVAERFDDFGRGVMSISSIAYFSLIAIFGLYLCMVLIGRRHWSGGKDGNKMFLHFFARVVLLAAIVVGGCFFFMNEDYRFDATEGKVSSVSSTTTQMIADLEPENAIEIEAYLSADVPELYAKTKYSLLTMLKEFQKTAKRNDIPMTVRIFDNLQPFDDEVKLAEQNYGITPQSVRVEERGAISDQNIILGAVVRSGLEKVVIPFFESGIPVEYELIRSINTVSQPTRMKLGILKTDAELMGGFSRATFQQRPRSALATELGKQYELLEVDPTSPILTDQIDALLAVQPSSLTPDQLANLITAVKTGLPTAIFEDPMPVLFNGLPGTGMPKQPAGMGQPPAPKGDIRDLFEVLSITMPGKPAPTSGGIKPDVLWQNYNPYPVLENMEQATSQWIFIREGMEGTLDCLSESNEITKGLRELMFLFAGAIQTVENPNISIETLVISGPNAGLIDGNKATMVLTGEASMESLESASTEVTGEEALAVAIRSKAPADPDSENAGDTINAVFVSDVDFCQDTFLQIRNSPELFTEVQFQMQNVSFVLNIIDSLMGQYDYAKIRRHEPQFTTLRLVEEKADAAKQEAASATKDLRDEFEKKKQEAEEELTKIVKDFNDRVNKVRTSGEMSVETQRELTELRQALEIKSREENQKLQVLLQRLERKLNEQIREQKDIANRSIRKTQNFYKALAVFIPPIPPLLVGIIVFVSRRLREREGITKSRLL
jgi:ABC-2 type transport system permease protein